MAKMFVFCFIAEAELKTVFVLVTGFAGWRGETDSYQLFGVICDWTRCSGVWGWGVPVTSKEIILACFLFGVANLILFP